MSKMNDMHITIMELRKCADVLVDTINFLTESFGGDVEEQPLTFEQVRGILASKSKDGKTAEVKELITTFGVDKLSDVKPEQYAELIDKAEAL